MTIQGRVKWFDRVKGYGFIVSPQVQGDIFVHKLVLPRDRKLGLPDGAGVTAEVSRRGDKWRADRVLSVRVVA